MPEDVYTHGHHESVLRSHTWRTAANSAAYLLPSLRAGLDLLDVGCGPGTITRDFAPLVAPGRVVGLDRSTDVLQQAAAAGSAGPVQSVDMAQPVRIEWRVGDVYALPFPDGSFDVVHAHQVLQHLSDPVRALVEMRRVLRPGGVLAARDSDYGAFTWTPADSRLDRWRELYSAVARRNGGEPDAGRFLRQWALAAGLPDVEVGRSTWTYADPESTAWWGNLWADRCEHSALGEQAIAYGLSTRGELQAIAAAWRAWAAKHDARFIVPHGELLVRL